MAAPEVSDAYEAYSAPTDVTVPLPTVPVPVPPADDLPVAGDAPPGGRPDPAEAPVPPPSADASARPA